MALVTEERGQASSLSSLLALPFHWFMAALNAPMSFVQRRFGIGGMGVVFLAPNMLIFGVFVLIPVAINVAYSLTGGTAIFMDGRHFVGLDQYRSLLNCENYAIPSTCQEDAFWQSVHNTAFFVVVQVTVLVLAALGTALVLNREMRSRGFWRSVFFFPVLLSPVVVGLIWKWILQRDGLLNAILLDFGFERTLWLAERHWAMFWAIFVSVWAHLGFYTLILLAGLQAIPRDLYEAAMMDGTGRLRTFWRITLPLLWPNLLVVVILALIRAVQIFDEAFVLTGGGPGTSTMFITQYIYETGFAHVLRNLGLASAASILMGIVLVALTALQLAVSNRRAKKEGA
ncbi:carbohydrate ABC transporter permease [Microvirga puerhi]|uniref:Sugar ABC transporter permease n=1 Tax=Microvirga puerhi TaxID=2876078 RepID=A0ABS7VJ72_9HYPH|nr:sugar ABC transporter permease [Microvirga puerhi]MBZ6075561.1 sugar ABC transporter permease [Microvirga puerhi]